MDFSKIVNGFSAFYKGIYLVNEESSAKVRVTTRTVRLNRNDMMTEALGALFSKILNKPVEAKETADLTASELYYFIENEEVLFEDF